MTASIDHNGLASAIYLGAHAIRQRKVHEMLAGAETLTGHFSICPLNDIYPSAVWSKELQPAYEALSTVHCINWRDMDDNMRRHVVTLTEYVLEQMLKAKAENWALDVMGG